MPKEDIFTVVIELGSSKVTAVAGRKQPDGAIQILASAQERSDAFIRKGRINNFDKMTAALDSIKKKLENTLNKTISGAYVGIGGMGMHTVANSVTRHLGEKQIITNSMVDDIIDTNKTMPGADREILEIIPQDYQLGPQTVADPVGMASDVIEGRFLNIISSTSMTESINKCFHAAKLAVVDRPIAALNLADAILSEAERRSGCVFVDMGAETTTVAVYKSNILRHFAVIPLGGANINNDLCTLQIEDSEAEALKRKFATAYPAEEDAAHDPIQVSDGRTFSFVEFSGLVQARVEEIILNINHQIELSKHDKTKLIAGIIVTGGASALQGMDTALKAHTGFDKVRFVKNLRLQCRVDGRKQPDFNADGSYNAVIALLDKYEANCCGGELGSTTNLFPSDEDIAKEQADKEAKAAEEAARLKSEEEAQAAKEAEEKPKKEKKPSIWSKFKEKLGTVTAAAGKLVSEEEDRFDTDEKKDK